MTDNAGNHGLPSATQAQRRSRILIVALGAALLSAAVWVWYGRSHEKGGELATPENIRPAGTPGPSSAGRLANFEDVAASAGLDFKMNFLAAEQGENFKVNLYDHGCGLAIADYDGDGHDDLFLINQLGANVLYRNRGDGTFKRASDDASPLALADRICVGAAFGDYDNDGDPDLYVTSTRGGNVLLENDGGQFRDVTEKSGAALVAHSQTPAFFDYDNDGDLDLYVTNVARWTSDEFNAQDRYFVGPLFLRQFLEGSAEDLEYNVLFQNDGQGHFTDVTREAGLESLSWSGDLAVFDYDGDGWLDVFVTNMFGRSQLYHNDRQGHFRDVTRETLRRTSFGAIGAKAFDYDNDGRLDLFVSDMHSDMLDLPKQSSLVEERKKLTQLPGPWRQMLMRQAGEDFEEVLLFGNALYRNQGEGAFVECSDAAGLETFWPWGVAVGDFDNDGDQDLFLPSGMGYPFFYWPNYLMLNNGQGAFVNVTDRSGIEPPADGRYLPETIGGEKAARSSRCAATADFDGDGRLDLVVNNFNDRPYYFKNQTAGGHYVAFRLRGTQSNRDAVGAVVQLRIGQATLVRQVDCAGGYLSQSSQTLHFGLGDVDH
ncbi:MAG TPA: CRTAC1 family protein, partial [Pirellulales bacterium]|nr:CRTAC1 family protein [Pirellulales bacterium]